MELIIFAIVWLFCGWLASRYDRYTWYKHCVKTYRLLYEDFSPEPNKADYKRWKKQVISTPLHLIGGPISLLGSLVVFTVRAGG